MIKRALPPGILACMLLAVAACSSSLAGGESGSVAMFPFTDQEYGIRGLAPQEGWVDQGVLLQESFAGTMDELVALAADQMDLIQLPRSTGTYTGAHLTWDLYTFETQVKDAGPGIYRVNMALANGRTPEACPEWSERGEGVYYLVILVALPADYAAHRARYDTVFEHALYALAPLEQ